MHAAEIFPAPIPERYRLLDDVQVLDLPDPEWLIDGILQRRSLFVLYGPSGAYKTTIVSGVQVALATGGEWFGHPVLIRGASIYIGAEDPSGYKMRLSAQKRAAGLPLTTAIGCYCIPEAIDLHDPVSIAGFIRLARDSGGVFEVVIIDTFAASTPGANENAAEDMTIAMKAALQIATGLGVAVGIVHHSNAAGSRERGHSAMRGAADTMISVTQVDDVILVECSKQRNGPPFAPVTLKPVPLPDGGITLRLASQVLQSSGLTTAQTKALAVLRDTFTADGATKAEWQRACHDVAERTFHRAAKILLERRHITMNGSHFRVAAGASR